MHLPNSHQCIQIFLYGNAKSNKCGDRKFNNHAGSSIDKIRQLRVMSTICGQLLPPLVDMTNAGKGTEKFVFRKVTRHISTVVVLPHVFCHNLVMVCMTRTVRHESYQVVFLCLPEPGRQRISLRWTITRT